jgi:hypothetical protein
MPQAAEYPGRDPVSWKLNGRPNHDATGRETLATETQYPVPIMDNLVEGPFVLLL